MRKGNGGEGFIGENSYLILWPVDDLHRFNREYEATTYAPGLLLIGSSGGGEAFAYDTRRTPWPVVRVPFVGMDVDLAEDVAKDFMSFLEALRTAE